VASTTPALPRRRGWRIALLAIGAVVLLVAGGAGIFAWSLTSTFDTQTTKLPDVFPAEENGRPAALEGDAAKSQNTLLLGADTRGPTKGRSRT